MTNEDKTLGRCFAEELDDDQWNRFLQIVYQQKLAETNKITDFESLEIDFSNEEIAIEQDSLCILYNNFFPFAETLRTKHNEKTYLLSDQYCLNSNCTCHDVLLSIADISNADKKIAEPISEITYDYITGVWSFIEDYGEEQAEVEEMMAASKAALQKIGKTCKDRHRIMRTIYGNYRKRTRETLALPSMKKTGRNDPCPCGSGKKYKKCCGR